MTINNIVWCFTNECYTDADKFNNDVTQYQITIDETDENWKPNEIVFNFPELQIQYGAWITKSSDLLSNESLIDEENAFDEENSEDGMFQVEVLAKLKADNGKSFTALEFLMKVHNQHANKELGDYVFFEGTDEDPEFFEGLPTCNIYCGS